MNENKMHLFCISAKKNSLKNTPPPQHVYDACQVPPLAHIGSVTLRSVNRNIFVSGSEKKKRKEESAFRAALDARAMLAWSVAGFLNKMLVLQVTTHTQLAGPRWMLWGRELNCACAVSFRKPRRQRKMPKEPFQLDFIDLEIVWPKNQNRDQNLINCTALPHASIAQFLNRSFDLLLSLSAAVAQEVERVVA